MLPKPCARSWAACPGNVPSATARTPTNCSLRRSAGGRHWPPRRRVTTADDRVMSPLWEPGPERIAATRLSAFGRQVGRSVSTPADYQALQQWSVESSPEFWSALWDFGGVIGNRGARLAVDHEAMP